MQAKQMFNEVGVNLLQSGEKRGQGQVGAVERAFRHTTSHTSHYYKISGQAVVKKDIERPLLSPGHHDGYADKMTA